MLLQDIKNVGLAKFKGILGENFRGLTKQYLSLVQNELMSARKYQLYQLMIRLQPFVQCRD